jgi:F-type H+-transporting ATPase subunit delta
MPAGGAVARRYAQAAFDIARDQNALDQWKHDLDLAAAIFYNPQVAHDFDDPKVSEANKRSVVTQNLQGKISPQALNLIYLLVKRGRTNLIGKVAAEFTDFYNRARNIAIADVTTAMPLGDEEMRKVAATLSRITGKQVQVHAHVDPRIIGGLVARIGDELIDASIATRLHELAMRMA